MWKGTRVLVVDDSQMARKLLQTILSREGARVNTATTGEEGISLWNEKHYDIVLIDLFLPDIFGLDLVRRMRSEDQESCIVVVTAHGDLDSAVEAIREGADGYVEKDLLTAPNGVVEFLQRLERSAALRAETVARMHLEQQLEEERNRLRQTLFGLAEFVIATDRDLRVHLMNPRAMEILGLEEEAQSAVPIESLNLPSQIVEMVRDVVKTGEMMDREIEWNDKICQMRIYPIFSRDREVTGAICVLRDVTEQKKLEQLRTHFFSMATHDLKSPLSVIVAYADYLKEGMAGELTPEQKRMVETILHSASKMSDMVARFLEHFSMSEGKLDFDWEPVDLVSMLGEITKNMSMVAQSRGVELTWEHEVPQARVWGDVQYLERAFSNILENALKYTPEGGKVSVSLRPVGEGYQVDISDTGPGIAKSLIPVIFRPYMRGADGLTKGKNGVGLGLYTAHRVISKANGRIEVESEIGKGTTFRIWMPALERGKPLSEEGK